MRIKRTLQKCGIARLDDAAIDEEAAIAVFGEAGQPVELGDAQPCGRQRLNQLVGEPLAELVKRNEPVPGHGRVTAAIPELYTAKAEPARPDRAEGVQQGA